MQGGISNVVAKASRMDENKETDDKEETENTEFKKKDKKVTNGHFFTAKSNNFSKFFGNESDSSDNNSDENDEKVQEQKEI